MMGNLTKIFSHVLRPALQNQRTLCLHTIYLRLILHRTFVRTHFRLIYWRYQPQLVPVQNRTTPRSFRTWQFPIIVLITALPQHFGGRAFFYPPSTTPGPLAYIWQEGLLLWEDSNIRPRRDGHGFYGFYGHFYPLGIETKSFIRQIRLIRVRLKNLWKYQII